MNLLNPVKTKINRLKKKTNPFSISFKLVNFKASIEGDLRKQYSISESVTNTYTDEVSLEIEPLTKVVYCFNWKRIWQKGIIKCLDKVDREVAFIPFQIVVGVTFDIFSE